MSDPDRRSDRRGAEPPLALDRRRPQRSRGPAPVTLIVSILLLVVVGGGVAYMYRAGPRAPVDVPQPLGSPMRDVRAPAPPQARPVEPGDGLTISRDEQGGPASQASRPPTFAPAPEQPLSSGPAPATAPAGAAAPSPPPTEEAKPPVVATRRVERSDAIGRLIAGADPSAVSGEGPAAPRPRAHSLDTEGRARNPSDSIVVQIGAFSSRQLADKEWSNAAAVAPAVMEGKGKRVVAVDRDGSTLYRTAITGFGSKTQALALCERLRAAGGHCIVY